MGSLMVLLTEERNFRPLQELATPNLPPFSNRNFENGTKYFLNSVVLNDFDDHSGSPNGRLGALRPPSSGWKTWRRQ